MSVLRGLLDALGTLAERFVRQRFIEVVDRGPNRLEFDSNRGRFVVDARRRVVTRDGRVVARFGEIRFIDVIHDHREGHGPEAWKLHLHLGPLRRVRMGATRDDVLASMLGARLHELTGARLLGWHEHHDLRT